MTQAPPNPQEPPPAALVHPVNSDRSPWNWLLVVPLLATLIPTIYNRVNPKFFGIPFFYWYQMGCIAIGVLCTLIVYRATRGER